MTSTGCCISEMRLMGLNQRCGRHTSLLMPRQNECKAGDSNGSKAEKRKRGEVRRGGRERAGAQVNLQSDSRCSVYRGNFGGKRWLRWHLVITTLALMPSFCIFSNQLPSHCLNNFSNAIAVLDIRRRCRWPGHSRLRL